MYRRADVVKPLELASGRDYRNLVRRKPFVTARRLDKTVSELEPSSVLVRCEVVSQQVTRIGSSLTSLDRETRRAAALMTRPGAHKSETVPRPISVSEGGYRLEDAKAGSSVSVLAPYGAVAAVLLSDPIQLALTVQVLRGYAAKLRIWWLRRHADDPMEKMTARQLLDAYDEFARRGLTLPPTETSGPRRAENTFIHRAGEANVGEEQRELMLPRPPLASGDKDEQTSSFGPKATEDGQDPEEEIKIRGPRSRTPQRITLVIDLDGDAVVIDVEDD